MMAFIRALLYGQRTGYSYALFPRFMVKHCLVLPDPSGHCTRNMSTLTNPKRLQLCKR